MDTYIKFISLDGLNVTEKIPSSPVRHVKMLRPCKRPINYFSNVTEPPLDICFKFREYKYKSSYLMNEQSRVYVYEEIYND